MMMRLKACLAATAVAVCAMPAHAQDRVSQPADRLATRYVNPSTGLSLAQAIEMALAREPGLQATRTELDAARAMRLQAGLRPNPTVSLARQEELSGTDNQTSMMVEWPLDLFRRAGRVSTSDRLIEATAHAVAERERQLAGDVRKRYGTVLAAARDLAIADDLFEVVGRNLQLLRERVNEGASPPLERDLVDAELRRIDADRQLRTARAEAALLDLKRVLGLPPAAPVAVRDTLEHLVGIVATSADQESTDVKELVERRPDVREAETRIRLADARVDQARREGRFDIGVYGMYMKMDAGFPQLAFGSGGSLERVRGLFHNAAFGTRVMVPLGNRNQGAIAAARAARAGAAHSYEARRLAAQTEIASATARDELTRRAVMIYGSGALALARQNLDVVRQTYELGRATVFDVLAEQRRYLDVEAAYTQALQAAFDARTDLLAARGELR